MSLLTVPLKQKISLGKLLQNLKPAIYPTNQGKRFFASVQLALR